MKNILFVASFAITLVCKAQSSDLILFTESGEEFLLYVNGMKINSDASQRVVARDISGDFALLNIRFNEPGAQKLKKQILIEPDKEITATIKKNKKGKYQFKLVSSVPKNMSTSEETIVLTSTQTYESQPNNPVPIEQTNSSSDSENIIDLQMNDNGNLKLKVNLPGENTTLNHTKQKEYANPKQHQNANLTARVEGKKILLSDGRSLDWNYVKTKSLTGVEIEMVEPVGANVDISYNGKSVLQSEIPFFYREPDWKRNRDYFKLHVVESTGVTWSVRLQHSNNNRILISGLKNSQPTTPASAVNDCIGMSSTDFERALNSIKNKPFEDEKMVVAQQIINANCLHVSQVVQMMNMFTYEEEKVALAKKAFQKTIDQNNFYQINDALTYSESVEEMNRFLENQ